MSWRTVVVSSRAKLEMKLNYLIIRSDTAQKIYLSEIGTLLIENTAVAITASLMCELMQRKINVIFCDEKRSPCFELSPYYGSHDTSRKIRNQIACPQEKMDKIWTQIVKHKIQKQMELMQYYKFAQESELLKQYIIEIEPGDSTNREGHAAKVYFNALFGQEFSRNSPCVDNSALNYGYAIILSAFNREIISNGYITQLGIFHNNIFNRFNLSSDLMEPFRPIVDKLVLKSKFENFGPPEKKVMVDVLNKDVFIENKTQYVGNAIKIYCKSVLDCLFGDETSEMLIYEYEF